MQNGSVSIRNKVNLLSMSYIIELCKSVEYISVSLVCSYCIMYFSMKLPRQGTKYGSLIDVSR